MKLDPGARTVTLSNKQEVAFGKALLATGANVRRLNVPGCELEGIHYLRTFGNTDAIREDAAGKRVVLIGGSYIAAEVAASLTELGSSCTLVMLEPRRPEPDVRRRGGALLPRHPRRSRHQILGDDELDRFEGTDGRVTKVITKAGRELDADAVVVGVGVVPDVMLARGAGLELGESGGIKVDSRCRRRPPGVFAAGDMAEYESVVHGGRRIRDRAWDVAFNQGRAAALNMLGEGHDYDVVPYFFSDLSTGRRWSTSVRPPVGPRGGPRVARRGRVHGLLPERAAGSLAR